MIIVRDWAKKSILPEIAYSNLQRTLNTMALLPHPTDAYIARYKRFNKWHEFLVTIPEIIISVNSSTIQAGNGNLPTWIMRSPSLGRGAAF